VSRRRQVVRKLGDDSDHVTLMNKVLAPKWSVDLFKLLCMIAVLCLMIGSFFGAHIYFCLAAHPTRSFMGCIGP
jgi:hypothetical protein